VLDFTHGVAGPYCTMLLGDLGADVVKVEKPGRGDATRYMNVSPRFRTEIPRVGGDYFLAINRNKRSLTLDLGDERGRALCRRLAAWADVAVQSFRPGVMARLGLDYAALSALNPRLVYGSLSAYGRRGPLADKPGMDVAVQARSGVMALTGLPESREPVRPGASLADFAGGAFLATALVTALFHRERTGEGQEVHASLLDATMSMLSNFAVAVLDGEAAPGPMGSGHPQLVPYQAFPTRDGHVVIATGTNKLYRDLCAVLGVPELADDPRFASNQDRVAHRALLVERLAAVTRQRTTEAWLAALEAGGVPCAPVLDAAAAFRQPQLSAGGLLWEVRHPAAGPLHTIGFPATWSRTGAGARRPPPTLGEHTDEVLDGLLGLDQAAIAALRADRVV
jgi:crotonobetainyl-CoA:carnitine CoA-transferase CaiB-like acyl-CoA transferase